MNQQKSGDPNFSAPPKKGFTFPFLSKKEPSIAVLDPIDKLVESLGEPLAKPDFIKSQSSSQVQGLMHSFRELVARAVPKRETTGQEVASITAVPETLPQEAQAQPEIILEKIFVPPPGSDDGLPAPAKKPMLPSIKLSMPSIKLSLPDFGTHFRRSQKPVTDGIVPTKPVADDSTAAKPSATKKKFELSRPFVLMMAAGTLGAFALGFVLFTQVLHKPHTGAHVVAKSTPIKTETAEKSGTAKAEKPLAEPAEKPPAAEGGAAVPAEKSEAAPAAEGEKSETGASKGEKEAALAEAPIDVKPSAEDARIIAQIRPQVKHLCGLQVSKVIGWNYRDGYLFCHIRNRRGELSNLLQRSSADGQFTYIGGTKGLISADELSDLFLVDSSVAKSLLAKLISLQTMVHVAADVRARRHPLL